MATGPQGDRRGYLWSALQSFYVVFLLVFNNVAAFPLPISNQRAAFHLPIRPAHSKCLQQQQQSSTYNHDCDHGNDEQVSPEAFEDALKELESHKLYGLAIKQVEIDQIASWLQRGKLNLFPEYQRDYVWKTEKASRLIATVLCNRHVPPVVLHEKKKGGYYDVVDGKQRLMSILGFYLCGNKGASKMPTNERLRQDIENHMDKVKRLEKLDESYRPLNNLSFDDLSPERQDAFQSYAITYLVIPFSTPKSDVFEVYDDINSGGEDLTPQQVRRAVYYGPYIRLLDELSESSSDFKAIRAPKEFHKGVYRPCEKHSDREMILRAFSFKNRGDQYKVPLKRFLNCELDGTDDFDEKDEKEKERVNQKLQIQRAEFLTVVKVARSVFGEAAFRKWAPQSSSKSRQQQSTTTTTNDYVWSTSVSLPLWDATYSALADLLNVFQPVQFTQAKDTIVQMLKESFESGFFRENSGGMSKKQFFGRKEEFKGLVSDAIRQAPPNHRRDDKRSFSRELREQLYNAQSGKCGICNQLMDSRRLDDGKYVHIDHIVPHSRGGETTNENAQLVHSECNLQKGNRYYVEEVTHQVQESK